MGRMKWSEILLLKLTPSYFIRRHYYYQTSAGRELKLKSLSTIQYTFYQPSIWKSWTFIIGGILPENKNPFKFYTNYHIYHSLKLWSNISTNCLPSPRGAASRSAAAAPPAPGPPAPCRAGRARSGARTAARCHPHLLQHRQVLPAPARLGAGQLSGPVSEEWHRFPSELRSVHGSIAISGGDDNRNKKNNKDKNKRRIRRIRIK